jgi:serine/threonine-protein kinase RsbW
MATSERSAPSSEPRADDRSVVVAIARDPALVRTVRLVAAAVARRMGRDEDFVEEVRLAVGEACALLVGDVGDLRTPAEPSRSRVSGASTDGTADRDLVSVRMSLEPTLAVEVARDAPVEVEDPPHSDIDGTEPWALLRGLVDNIDVHQEDGSTRVLMSWPMTSG